LKLSIFLYKPFHFLLIDCPLFSHSSRLSGDEITSKKIFYVRYGSPISETSYGGRCPIVRATVGKVDTQTAPKQRLTLGKIHCSQLQSANRKDKLSHFWRRPTGSFRSDLIGRYSTKKLFSIGGSSTEHPVGIPSDPRQSSFRLETCGKRLHYVGSNFTIPTYPAPCSSILRVGRLTPSCFCIRHSSIALCSVAIAGYITEIVPA
jgi:hypothetical protein